MVEIKTTILENNQRKSGESEARLIFCTSCCRVVSKENSVLEPLPEFSEEVSLIRCTSCDKCMGLLVEQNFESIEEILFWSGGSESNGWRKVATAAERRLLFVLSEIIHNEEEESIDMIEFILPPVSDFVKILSIQGEAIGFYSIKPKGTLDFETMGCYSMTTLDTIFIRTSQRRQGFGLSALQHILIEFPSQNIGFSYPLSCSMKLVLWKHLKEKTEDRPRFWETTGCFGTHANARNLWLILQKGT